MLCLKGSTNQKRDHLLEGFGAIRQCEFSYRHFGRAVSFRREDEGIDHLDRRCVSAVRTPNWQVRLFVLSAHTDLDYFVRHVPRTV